MPVFGRGCSFRDGLYRNIIVRDGLTEEEERVFLASLHAMADYGLGKNRSRGFGALYFGNIKKSDRIPGLEGS